MNLNQVIEQRLTRVGKPTAISSELGPYWETIIVMGYSCWDKVWVRHYHSGDMQAGIRDKFHMKMLDAVTQDDVIQVVLSSGLALAFNTEDAIREALPELPAHLPAPDEPARRAIEEAEASAKREAKRAAITEEIERLMAALKEL